MCLDMVFYEDNSFVLKSLNKMCCMDKEFGKTNLKFY